MTKALLCRNCVDIRALPAANNVPVTCRCENLSMWWTDYLRGRAQASAKARCYAYFLDFNDLFLRHALMDPHRTPDQWQSLHKHANDAPGHPFDHRARDCWAVAIKVGQTDDVSFYEQPEPSTDTPSTFITWNATTLPVTQAA